MKKYILVLFLIIFIIPSIALASWWNPFSWKIFHKKVIPVTAQTVNNETAKTPEEQINELQKEIDGLKSRKDKPLDLKTNISISENKITPTALYTPDASSINLLESINTKLDTYTKTLTDRKNLDVNNISIANRNLSSGTLINEYATPLIKTSISFYNTQISDTDFMLNKLKQYKDLVIGYKKLIQTTNQKISLLSLNDSVTELLTSIDNLITKQNISETEFLAQFANIINSMMQSNSYYPTQTHITTCTFFMDKMTCM